MMTMELQVARTIGDLAGLPVGTRIATSHNKLMILGEFAGSTHWYEHGELVNYQALVHWLPAYILPPRRPTAEEVEWAKTSKGGYTRAQLEEWGVPWPPPPGWKEKLLSGEG